MCVCRYMVGCLCCLGDKKEGAALGEDTIDENYGVAVVFHEDEGEGQEEKGGDTYVREEPVEEEGEGVEAEFEGVLHAEVGGLVLHGVVCVCLFVEVHSLPCPAHCVPPAPPTDCASAGHGRRLRTGSGHAKPPGCGRILATA